MAATLALLALALLQVVEAASGGSSAASSAAKNGADKPTASLKTDETALQSKDLSGEPRAHEAGTIWYDARDDLLLRQAGPWPTYQRLPPEAVTQVRSEVWGDALDSAGLVVYFDASGGPCSSLSINVTMQHADLDMPHMPATGVSGFDLYAFDEATLGGMRWVANYVTPWFGKKVLPTVGSLVGGLKPGLDRFALFLPLYNGVTALKIGAAPRCKLAKPSVDVTKKREDKGAVLVYGTSITQGGVVSRPGNAWTNVLGRLLDRDVYNFGFSGNGEMELNVTQFLLRVPHVSVIIIDCSQNMPGARICGEGLNSEVNQTSCSGADAIRYRAPRLVRRRIFVSHYQGLRLMCCKPMSSKFLSCINCWHFAATIGQVHPLAQQWRAQDNTDCAF
jgi:hypothetical protein